MKHNQLKCGAEGDIGHHMLNVLEKEVEALNATAAKLRREGYTTLMKDQVIARATADGSGSTVYHSGLLSFHGSCHSPFSIDEREFFNMYRSTDAGKYAARSAEANKGEVFGQFVKREAKQ